MRGTPPVISGGASRLLVLLAGQAAWLSRNSAIASAGVFQPSVLRGRPFSSSATSASRCGVCPDRSLPLGKYWRSSPLVFSLVPPLPGRVRVAEVDLAVRGDRDLRVRRPSPCPGPRSATGAARPAGPRSPGSPAAANAAAAFPPGIGTSIVNRVDRSTSVPICRLPGLARDQVAFPVPGHRPVRSLGRPLADVHHALDPPAPLALGCAAACAAPARSAGAAPAPGAARPRPCTYSDW